MPTEGLVPYKNTNSDLRVGHIIQVLGRSREHDWTVKLEGSEKVLFFEGTLGSPPCCLLQRMGVGHSHLVGHPLVASKCENRS